MTIFINLLFYYYLTLLYLLPTLIHLQHVYIVKILIFVCIICMRRTFLNYKRLRRFNVQTTYC